jgi:response regulator of citrate/malate metabolism
VIELLRHSQGLSSAQVARGVGIAVQTARRYLDYLATQRLAARTPIYGGAGRAEQRCRWTGDTDRSTSD